MKAEEIEKVNKLKLQLNEVVHCESFELACRCCELAHKLGLTWNSGVLYIHQIFYKEKSDQIFYNFHKGTFVTHPFSDKTSITATEWLNRHGIFVFGQEVLCTDHEDTSKANCNCRIYVAPYVSVHKKDSERLGQKISFATTVWPYMYSTFPEWKDIEEDTIITLANGTKVKLSKESYEELKKAVS